jgi:hypothetical protein
MNPCTSLQPYIGPPCHHGMKFHAILTSRHFERKKKDTVSDWILFYFYSANCILFYLRRRENVWCAYLCVDQRPEHISASHVKLQLKFRWECNKASANFTTKPYHFRVPSSLLTTSAMNLHDHTPTTNAIKMSLLWGQMAHMPYT